MMRWLALLMVVLFTTALGACGGTAVPNGRPTPTHSPAPSLEALTPTPPLEVEQAIGQGSMAELQTQIANVGATNTAIALKAQAATAQRRTTEEYFADQGVQMTLDAVRMPATGTAQALALKAQSDQQATELANAKARESATAEAARARADATANAQVTQLALTIQKNEEDFRETLRNIALGGLIVIVVGVIIIILWLAGRYAWAKAQVARAEADAAKADALRRAMVELPDEHGNRKTYQVQGGQLKEIETPVSAPTPLAAPETPVSPAPIPPSPSTPYPLVGAQLTEQRRAIQFVKRCILVKGALASELPSAPEMQMTEDVWQQHIALLAPHVIGTHVADEWGDLKNLHEALVSFRARVTQVGRLKI